MPENLEPPLDIEKEFKAVIDGHGDTIAIPGEAVQLPGVDMTSMLPHKNELYSVLRSNGTVERGWSPLYAGGNSVHLQKLALDGDGNPVTLTKQVEVNAFAETQRLANKLHVDERPVSVEMGKRVLMIQEVLDRKRKDTFQYNHRDDLDVIDDGLDHQDRQ